MKKAIYLRLVLMTAATVLLCGLISSLIFMMQAKRETEYWLRLITLSAADDYRASGSAAEISKDIGDIRVTVIAPDGAVLFDSDADISKMENHAERPEVKNAALGRVYVDLRKSVTLGASFMYSSVKLEDGEVLRLAYRYSGLLKSVANQFPAIIAAMVSALLLSMFLARWLLRAATGPLKKIQTALSADNAEALREYPSDDYEIYQLTQSIRFLWQKIADANHSLVAEREKTNYLLSNMPEGFILIDGNKRILLCNASAKRFFGCKHEVESQNILTLTRDTGINRAIGEALSGGQSAVLEVKSKKDAILRVSVSPVINGELTGNESGVTVMLTDITAGRQLERQKHDFFSNASHELRTPITSILGFAEMLAGGIVESDEKQKGAAQTIEKEARRMSSLIDDILTISDLESGAADEEAESFNFDSVVREAAETAEPLCKSKDVRLELDLERVPVQANSRRIYELCMNLIVNSVKYNKQGGTVLAALKTDEKGAVLTVRDTGIGIAEEYQGRVFERFFRVDSGRDKKVGGTGLGLSIVKHIVNLYGGEITLKSKLGEGTAITVSLPILAR